MIRAVSPVSRRRAFWGSLKGTIARKIAGQSAGIGRVHRAERVVGKELDYLGSAKGSGRHRVATAVVAYDGVVVLSAKKGHIVSRVLIEVNGVKPAQGVVIVGSAVSEQLGISVAGRIGGPIDHHTDRCIYIGRVAPLAAREGYHRCELFTPYGAEHIGNDAAQRKPNRMYVVEVYAVALVQAGQYLIE